MAIRVRLRDVAQACGVSVGTVSRVLNRHPTVTPSVRAKVEDAVRSLNYEMDLTAQSMRGSKSRLVACAIRDFALPHFATFVKGAERELGEHGYTLILSSTGNSPEREIALLREFARRKVDGVMMTMGNEVHPAVRAAIDVAPMPVLLIDRNDPGIADWIAVDHRQGAIDAAAHLFGLGHARIAILVGDIRAYPARSRVEGFRAAHAKLGVKPDPRLVRKMVLAPEDASKQTLSLLDVPAPPTAIFTASMDVLGGTLRALRARNLRAGRDVALVTGTDSDLAELHDPPIPAVSWDAAEMGRRAAAMLLERMSGRGAAERQGTMLPTHLVRAPAEAPPIASADRLDRDFAIHHHALRV